MHSELVVIGSGFAAYQLIKSLRRSGNTSSITVISADAGHDYNKPDLSHVFSKGQTAEAMISQRAEQFAAEYQVTLLAHHRVSAIDPTAKVVEANGQRVSYSKLVLATGATTFMPPIGGDASAEIITHNSLDEYQRHGATIAAAKAVAIVGGGLIGVELAFDLAASGKQVTIVEPNPRLMQNLLPDYVEMKLRQQMGQDNIKVVCGQFVASIDRTHGGQQLALNGGEKLMVDATILATGLRANVDLAQQAGLAVNHGIVVDDQLQTSAQDIYALGDCAEFEGEVRAFLQPIVVSAAALAKTLAGTPSKVTLPKMLVKVKTPTYPMQLAGKTADGSVARWSYQVDSAGMVATAFDDGDKMIGFVATSGKVKQAFSLLRQL